MKRCRRHVHCRPPEGATHVEKWNGQAWVPDDGNPGLAFSALAPGGRIPVAYYTHCGNRRRDVLCVSEVAMSRTLERWSCANGQPRPPS